MADHTVVVVYCGVCLLFTVVFVCLFTVVYVCCVGVCCVVCVSGEEF